MIKLKFFWMLIFFVVFVVGCDTQNGKSLKFSGTLEITEHLLGAKVPGKVATLAVDEGDLVQAGQVLATLDRYEQNQRDYERVKQIYDSGGTSQQNLEHAAINADDQKIISPINGVVLVKVHELGEVVAAGSAVVVIGDPSDMWVRVYIPEALINSVQMGQPAAIYVDGIKEPLPGHVSFIATKAEFTPRNVQTPEERATQTFAVKVKIDQPSTSLHPGVGADVVIRIEGQRHE